MRQVRKSESYIRSCNMEPEPNVPSQISGMRQIRKYLSNLEVVDQRIAAITTAKLKRVGNAQLPQVHNYTKGVPNMKIYAGNLAPEVTEEELRQEFQAFGQVTTADIIKDRFTARPKGFAFVEMSAVAEGQAAIAGLNGKILKDRTLTVNAARPRPEDGGNRSHSDRRGGGFGGGSGRRNRY